MILLLGDDNPIGRAFRNELQRRRLGFASLGFHATNLADLHSAYDLVRKTKPDFVIIASSIVQGDHCLAPKPREMILHENVIIPQTITQVCRMRNVRWARVSSGSVFQGLKVFSKGRWHAEIAVRRPEIRRMVRSSSKMISGFHELDEPNHCFVCPPCEFQSGAAAMGEQAIRNVGQGYIWRHGVLLEENCRYAGCHADEPDFPEGFSSGTVLSDFVQACLQLWEGNAATGIYHIVNPGVLNLSVQGPPDGFRALGLTTTPACLLDDTKMRLFGVALPALNPIRIGSSAPFGNGSNVMASRPESQAANAV